MNDMVNPEEMTLPELGWEIERLEYERRTRKAQEPDAKEAIEEIRHRLEVLRAVMQEKVNQALGVVETNPDDLPWYQLGALPALYDMQQLERPEDILGGWYLFYDFPMLTDRKKMQQIEAELLRQQAALEAEKPTAEREGTLGLWQYRRELRAKQLKDLRDIMRRRQKQNSDMLI